MTRLATAYGTRGGSPVAASDFVSARPRIRVVAWAVFVATVLLRLPYVLHDRAVDDESFYSVAGIELLEGGAPYVAAVDRKPPLVAITFAAAFELVGEYDFVGLHAFALAWTLATMLALFLVGRRFGGEFVGLAAAFLYSIYVPNVDYRNQAFNGELMINAPIAWALLLAFEGSTRRVPPRLFLSGVLLGVACAYKQPAALAAVAVGGYVCLPIYRRRRGITVGAASLHAGAFVAGVAAALAVVALWLARQNVLDEALHWTFVTDFVSGPTNAEYWRRGMGNSAAFFLLPCMPAIVCAAASVREGRTGRAYFRGHEPELVALLALLAASGVGVGASGRFFGHYYIQLLVPLALVAAPAFARVASGDTHYDFVLLRPKWLRAHIVACFVVFTVVQVVSFQLRERGGPAASYVRSRSSKQDRIFVWGPSPDFYLDAERRPASRYSATFPLTGFAFGTERTYDPSFDADARVLPGAWRTLERDLEAHPPRFIVDEFSLLGRGKYAASRYAVLRTWLERYRLVLRTKRALVYERRAR